MTGSPLPTGAYWVDIACMLRGRLKDIVWEVGNHSLRSEGERECGVVVLCSSCWGRTMQEMRMMPRGGELGDAAVQDATDDGEAAVFIIARRGSRTLGVVM
jgi:hypothetical protein